MASKNNPIVTVDIANPHTIKKFELIEEYVKAWAPKLLNYQGCNGIVFIDCMCNSGIYQDGVGNEVFGTPIRVANYLSDIMKSYPSKHVWLYFNDLSADKINILKSHLPADTSNFHIATKSGDGNELLKAIGDSLSNDLKLNYLLVYDPYTASVDWTALIPFLQKWGEVIINHMISDSIRGVAQARNDVAVEKLRADISS
jgi:three-Cys-motif partner protein